MTFCNVTDRHPSGAGQPVRPRRFINLRSLNSSYRLRHNENQKTKTKTLYDGKPKPKTIQRGAVQASRWSAPGSSKPPPRCGTICLLGGAKCGHQMGPGRAGEIMEDAIAICAAFLIVSQVS